MDGDGAFAKNKMHKIHGEHYLHGLYRVYMLVYVLLFASCSFMIPVEERAPICGLLDDRRN